MGGRWGRGRAKDGVVGLCNYLARKTRFEKTFGTEYQHSHERKNIDIQYRITGTASFTTDIMRKEALVDKIYVGAGVEGNPRCSVFRKKIRKSTTHTCTRVNTSIPSSLILIHFHSPSLFRKGLVLSS